MSAFVAASSGLAAAVRLGLRDLRGGLKGFGIFIACIALGVAAIAGVGSFARGMVEGLSREGRVILGADASFQVMHRELDPPVAAALAERGTVALMATTRAMARLADGRAALAEVKAVEPSLYPLFGTLRAEPDGPAPQLLAPRDGRPGVLVEPALLASLDLGVGDRLMLGDVEVAIAGVLRQEPDRLAGGVGFGPRVIVGLDAFRATGLIQPGSLIRWHYQVKLSDQAASDAAVQAFANDMRRRFPEAGFEVRTRMNASPQLARQVERFAQFLTLVGLTALLVGGVGVANAVAGLVDRKRDDIATLKAVGATGGLIFAAMLAEVGGVALVGTVIGLAAGAALPALIAALFGAVIPLPVSAGVYPGELATAAAYGLLVALAFALPPLGRAHDVPVSALFRDTVDSAKRWPRPRYAVLTAAVLAALLALAVATSYSPRLALMFAAGAAGAFLALRVVALAIMALAARLPRPRGAGLRLALSNLHRPGAATPAVVLSLGLGLTLLTVIALVDSSFRRQVEEALPERAPSFYFMDIPNAEAARFDAFMAEHAPGAQLQRVPMLRGRFVALGGRPVEEIEGGGDIRWMLSGDRGLSHAEEVPAHSRVVSGEWWPKGYSGPPLVSLDERMAHGFGLKLGDEVMVNVLGRNLTARIASFRQIQWDSLGINFVVVFSPNAFRGASPTHLATLTYDAPRPVAEEVALLRAVTAAFPGVSTLRVKEAIEAVAVLARQIAAGIRGASIVTLAAAILVLAGALAAGHRARVYDAVILRVLGAGRPMLIATYAAEYLLLGLATAVFGIAAGAVAAYVVIASVMDIPFVFSAASAAGIVLLAVAVTVAFGLLGTWRALGAKPAPVLRNM